MGKGPKKLIRDNSGSSSPDRPPSSSPASVLQKSKHGKPHSKKSVVVQWLVKLVALLLLPGALALVGYQMHMQWVVLPRRVHTPSDLPKVLSEDAFSPKTNPDLYWGTFRSNLYFGMRTRNPKSPVVGLMWYEQPRNEIVMPKMR